jgi:hypothetical protein
VPETAPEPPWTPVTRVEGTVERSKYTGQFQLTLPASEQGEFEYRLVARVPALDLARASEKPLEVSVTSTETFFEIHLPIDPYDPSCKDDKITLESTDGSYKETKTVKDDTELGDDQLTLRFENVDHSKKYTLTVDAGGGHEPYKVFENAPLPS